MKKAITLTLMILLLATVFACSSANQKQMTFLLNGTAAEGKYTGPMEKGQANGEGLFVTNGSTVSGMFEAGKIKKAKVDSLPISVSLAGTSVSGSYAGDVTDGMLTGNGVFSSNDYVIEGVFSEGKIISGTINHITVDIVINKESFTGVYSGDITNNQLSGNGKVVCDDFVIQGTFSDGEVEDCTIDQIKTTIEINDVEFTGKYSGVIKNGKIEGEGEFVSDETTIKGTFGNNVIESGTVEGFPIKTKYNNVSFAGSYSGEVTNNVPNGNGSCDCKSGTHYLVYDGDWVDGLINGNGTIDTDSFTNDFGDVKRDGTYKGELKNQKPEGKGQFSSVNNAGYHYTYVGSWKNGTYHGQGKVSFKETSIYMEGNFTNGDFDPTLVQAYNYLGTDEEDTTFVLDSNTEQFVNTHKNLLVSMNVNDAKQLVDTSFDYKEYAKSQKSFVAKVGKVTNLYVIQIYELEVGKYTFTSVLACDKATYSQYYHLFFVGTMPGIVEGKRITAYFTPFAYSSYTTVSNTKQHAIVGALIAYE